jgi:hypothetical protein
VLEELPADLPQRSLHVGLLEQLFDSALWLALLLGGRLDELGHLPQMAPGQGVTSLAGRDAEDGAKTLRKVAVVSEPHLGRDARQRTVPLGKALKRGAEAEPQDVAAQRRARGAVELAGEVVRRDVYLLCNPSEPPRRLRPAGQDGAHIAYPASLEISQTNLYRASANVRRKRLKQDQRRLLAMEVINIRRAVCQAMGH